MRHIWTVICRNVLEDKNTGNMGLVDIVERLTLSAEMPDERPFTVSFAAPLHIVSNWWNIDENDESNNVIRIRLVSPEKTELVNEEQRLEFEDAAKLRTSGQLGSLPYTVNGIYEFEVAYKKKEEWEIVARIPLEIIREQPDPVQQESESTE